MTTNREGELKPCELPMSPEDWIRCLRDDEFPMLNIDVTRHRLAALIETMLWQKEAPAPVEADSGWEEFIEQHTFTAKSVLFYPREEASCEDVIAVDDLRARLASLPAAVPSVPVSQLHSLLANWKLAMFQLDGKAMVAVRECINDLHEVVDLHAGKP